MTKNLVLAGILGAFAMSTHAQSSMTLYGPLDAGMIYANNAGGNSVWQLGSGALSYNYFGLHGVEDLGGGLKAIFKLESGFAINSGRIRNGDFLNRQAWVGLSRMERRRDVRKRSVQRRSGLLADEPLGQPWCSE